MSSCWRTLLKSNEAFQSLTFWYWLTIVRPSPMWSLRIEYSVPATCLVECLASNVLVVAAFSSGPHLQVYVCVPFVSCRHLTIFHSLSSLVFIAIEFSLMLPQFCTSDFFTSMLFLVSKRTEFSWMDPDFDRYLTWPRHSVVKIGIFLSAIVMIVVCYLDNFVRSWHFHFSLV